LKLKALTVMLAGFGAISLTGCESREDSQALLAASDPVAACGDIRSDTAKLAALRESDAALFKAARSGSQPDAVAEAQRALKAGDYRLAAAATPNGISTELYGAQCRVLGGIKSWNVRAIAFVPDEAAALGRGPDDKITAFGRQYNAAVLADPRYPYADVCRELDRAGPKPDFSNAGVDGIEQPYGYAELGTARMAHGLGAAARRGSVYDINILLTRDKQDVNAADMFGMTPLAWAIAYHRWPAAEALLAAKATPTGASCQTSIDRQSPLQVARIMRWDGMIRRLRPLVTEDEFASLRQKPKWDDESLIEFNHALTELKDRFAVTLRSQPFTRHDLIFEIDRKGNTINCTIEPASPSAEFDKELCDIATDVVRWAPARDAFGTTVPESAKLVVGFGGK